MTGAAGANAPRGVGHLRGDTPFPMAAERALTDDQLRRNLLRATSTIQAKRAKAVAELAAGRRAPTAEAAAMAGLAWTMRSRRRWTWALRAVRLGRVLGWRQDRITRLPAPLSAWTASRDVPRPPRQSFRDWWARR
jgi:L-lactate utilization protein LutB